MNVKKLAGNWRIQLVLLVVLASCFLIFLSDGNPYTFDPKLGIEFVGGVRIPISLEKSVDATTMDSIVETLKNRVNSFGLAQAVIRPIGDKDVLVEIPRADEKVITNVKRILQEQGKFEGIIDGKVAVSGENVVAVGGPNGEATPATTATSQWSLSFTVTRHGADLFAEAARGKAQYPVYMFLDRPENAAVIVDKNEVQGITEVDLRDSLKKNGDDILLLYADELTANSSLLNERDKVVLSEATLPSVQAKLEAAGFSLDPTSQRIILVKSNGDLVPIKVSGELSEWKAIGLLSSPKLSDGLSHGTASQFYSITGVALGASQQEQEEYALNEIKRLKSVINGGRLPVSALVGSSFVIAPVLGKQFLLYSLLATILAIVVVAGLIIARYRDFKLSIPIILINACEIVILTAVLGTIGTIDLSAMAGIISLIGTGVDDQLIVTDEVLGKKKNKGEENSDDNSEYNMREKIGKAFSIIFTTAGVAIVAMMPLLLSGVVEISGFALAAVIGILIGIFITRPAFAAIIEAMYRK